MGAKKFSRDLCNSLAVVGQASRLSRKACCFSRVSEECDPPPGQARRLSHYLLQRSPVIFRTHPFQPAPLIQMNQALPPAGGFRCRAENFVPPLLRTKRSGLGGLERGRGRDGHDRTRDACAPLPTASFRLEYVAATCASADTASPNCSANWLNLEKAVQTTKHANGHETLAAPLRPPLTRQVNICAAAPAAFRPGLAYGSCLSWFPNCRFEVERFGHHRKAPLRACDPNPSSRTRPSCCTVGCAVATPGQPKARRFSYVAQSRAEAAARRCCICPQPRAGWTTPHPCSKPSSNSRKPLRRS